MYASSELFPIGIVIIDGIGLMVLGYVTYMKIVAVLYTYMHSKNWWI